MVQLSDEDIIKRVGLARDHMREWRKQAREAYAFFAGDQWSDEDKAILEENSRPPVVFNRVARTINLISGLEVQNRQEVRYIPRENQDTGFNDALTAASKWVRDLCDAEDEETESFQDLLISGMGWTETRMDYEEDLDGEAKVDRVDPMEMSYDPSSKKRNLDDSGYITREKRYSQEEFKELFPDADVQVMPEDVDFLEDDEHDAFNAYKYENDQSHTVNKEKRIIVTQIQYVQRETVYRVQTPQGMILLNQTQFKDKKDHIELSGFRHVKQKKKIYYQAFVAGGKVLENGKAPYADGFTFRCMTGMRDRNKNRWFGLVEIMKDPQRWANKWLSQIMFILNSNSKGGLLAEEGAFTNPHKAEEDWSRADSIINLQPGGLGKIQERQQTAYPQGIDRLMQYAIDAINDAPGVSLELMGLTGRAQAGILELQRRQSGLTILATFFDSLRRYRKEQGRVMAYFIREFIADNRLIRILGPEGHQYIPLMKDSVAFKYDVIVDDAPTSPNMKEKVFALLTEMMPTFMNAGIPITPELLDYAPLPESLIQNWKQFIKQNQSNPSAEIAQKLELEGKQLENQETESKTVLNIAKARKEVAVALDETAQAEQKREGMFLDAEIKREKNLIDAAIKAERNKL